MKQKMGDIGATPSSSQGAVAATLTDDVLMALPRHAAINRALQRHRKKLLTDRNGGTPLPPLPVDLTFVVPDSFADMVVFDSGPGNDCIIMIGCDVLLDGLARAEIWLGDGTFSVVVTIFFQLYSIYFQFEEGMNPATVYCMLTKRPNLIAGCRTLCVISFQLHRPRK